MVAVEYDGDQHRKDRTQYLKDSASGLTNARMHGVGTCIRVVDEDSPTEMSGTHR